MQMKNDQSMISRQSVITKIMSVVSVSNCNGQRKNITWLSKSCYFSLTKIG